MPSDIKDEINKIGKDVLMEASNETNAAKTFYDRILFKSYAYSDTSATLNATQVLPIRDFQKYENYLYGRINVDFLATVPKKGFLDPIGESGQYAFGFVVSAFESMKEEIQRDVASGKIPRDVPFISDIKATKAFEDINVKYNRWLSNSLKGSFTDYLRQFEKMEEVVDFETFMKVFREHLAMIAEQVNVVNFSSFCLVKKSNIRNSGLCIEIADLDFSKDSEKIEFSNNSHFSYYVNMAQRYGFFVDYNAPWRLVYNLASHRVTSQSSWQGLHFFFDSYFTPAHKDDLTILKNLCFTTYRDFINRYKSFRKTTIAPGGCIKKKLFVREKYTKEQFDKDYPDSYWLKFYIDLKNIEKNLNFDKNQLDRVKKKSLEYEKYVDIRKAMGYINKVFQDIPTIEGSFYYTLNKVHYKHQEPLPFEEFDRYIQDVVKSYKIK